MDFLADEHRSLNVSLWNTGGKVRQDMIAKLDVLMIRFFSNRRRGESGYLDFSEPRDQGKELTLQLYMIFRRYVFSALANFFRGYYDISLSNTRVALESAMYAHLFHRDKNLEAQYKEKKQLKKLYDKFSKASDELGDITIFQETYNLSNKRGAHCDYSLLEQTMSRGQNGFAMPFNDVLDEGSGAFDEALFKILHSLAISLKIFNLCINDGDQPFKKAFDKEIGLLLEQFAI